MASKVRSSWPTEIDGTAELELLELVVLLEDELEELQAAAARHKASAAETHKPLPGHLNHINHLVS